MCRSFRRERIAQPTQRTGWSRLRKCPGHRGHPARLTYVARAKEQAPLSSVAGLTTAGPVMVIGGAEDKFRDKAILARFAKFAGGHEGHVVVISTASSLGEAATDLYRELFGRPGDRHGDGRSARGARGRRTITGSRRSCRPRPACTSPGATSRAWPPWWPGRVWAMPSSWPTTGERYWPGRRPARAPWPRIWSPSAGPGPRPKNRMAQLSAGLGILHGVVIDQHFEQRGRMVGCWRSWRGRPPSSA